MHRERLLAAQKIDDQRAAAADLTVPAPWPPTPTGPKQPDRAEAARPAPPAVTGTLAIGRVGAAA